MPVSRGVASGWTGWTMSRGPPNQNEFIGLGSPHCSLSMGPQGSCYACTCQWCISLKTCFRFRVLVRRARKLAQQYYLTYNEEIPTAQLVQRVATVMQEFTQSGYAVFSLLLSLSLSLAHSLSLSSSLSLSRPESGNRHAGVYSVWVRSPLSLSLSLSLSSSLSLSL